jgi:hypothetical protein
MITEIYINGDSYSANNREQVAYSNFIANQIDIPVTNHAVVGSCNDRIFRTTLEYCANLKQDQRPLIIVGFSFITREEIWIDDISKYSRKIRDYPGSQFITSQWIDTVVDEATMHAIIDQNINKQTTHFYVKLFMFIQTLKSLNLPYHIFSAANNADFRNLNWDALKNLQTFQKISQDPNVRDLHKFNIGKWAEDNHLKTTTTKHLYEDGHKMFADYLLKNVINDLICKR